ncbi:MAG: hypothetical protein N3E51_03560 [Candidatus Micrarchaeota archaeon]|nr:hypothetical protein [Candidatus Micrarchaeota archaeon]
MLAYELFLKNRKTDFFKTNPKLSGTYVRKVYVAMDKGKYRAELDDALPAEVGAADNPLRLIPGDAAGLPDRGTGSNSPKPYVLLDVKINKKQLQISFKDFRATFSFEDKKEQIKKGNSIRQKMEKERVFLNGRRLYDLYVQNKILEEIDGKTYVNQDALEASARAFFKAVEAAWTADKMEKFKKVKLCILPEKGNLDYKAAADRAADSNEEKWFIDSFGNRCSKTADSTTLTAKFLSYDDPIFTLNLRSKREYYDNLGIGMESLEKIELPKGFKISGLTFIFYDIDNPDKNFEKKEGYSYDWIGFYNHLLNIYREMDKTKQPAKRGQLKTIVLKPDRAKLEVLIDSNLTFDQLGEILGPSPQPCPDLFEQLINRDGKNVLWNDYIWAIRSFLSLHPVKKDTLIAKLLFHLKRKRQEFIKNEGGRFVNAASAREFFSKNQNLIKILCRGDGMAELTSDENWAYIIGQITGKYISFRKRAGEASKSLTDILTYSKYDEERLKHVFNRISAGISISNADETSKAAVQKFIKERCENAPLKLEKPYEDYSYFFYRGVFETIE